MCQPKSKGGKRCLIHASASKFVTRATKVKTGADETVIKETLTELNKEGKNLPAPEVKEVTAWIDTKKFATQYDPELDDHERKIQMNQLERASKEVKAGVTGGHFHAWKNLMSAVRSKIGRRVTAGAVAGLMAFSLVGCFQNNGTSPFDGNSNTPSTSTSQEYGAVVPGETVTDQYGSYQQIRIDESDPNSQFPTDVVQPSAYDGFSEEDIQTAHQEALDYFVTQFADSSALDTGPEGYAEWYANSGSLFSDEIYNDPATASGEANVILSNAFTDQMPQLVRDGAPRASNVSYEVTDISGGNYNGANYVDITISYTIDYRVSDQAAVSFFAKRANMSEEEFLASSTPTEAIKDGSGENRYTVSGYTRLGLAKNSEGQWHLNGFNMQGDFDTAELINK